VGVLGTIHRTTDHEGESTGSTKALDRAAPGRR
jgi:hypothetical protein